MSEPKLLPNGATPNPQVRERMRGLLAAALAECAKDPEGRQRRSREAAEARFGRRAA
ncbi:hypothetical protein [Melissospora conviva]|uniref:hypothetical protein n=1 Tax=Melissospora conviva TaxID=3388432 RepID=UPI003C1CB3FA